MQSINIHNLDDFPAVRALGLTDAELAMLASQGFVSTERRPGKLVYKLRFRIGGRQCVRFLGHDETQARAIREELRVLQRDLRHRRETVKLRRAVNKLLRDSKRQLQPLLEQNGYYFHGRAIRLRRSVKTTDEILSS
jgi:hypothetical protein